MAAAGRGRDWVPITVPLVVFLQSVFLLALIATDGYDAARTGEWLRVLLTYVSVAALFGLVHLLSTASPASPARRRPGFVPTLLVYVLFLTLELVRFETAGQFDYGFARENAREMGNATGWTIVLASVHWRDVLLLWVVPLLLFGLVLRHPPRPWPGSGRSRAITAVVLVALLIGLPLMRVSSHESLTTFAASVLRYHAQSRDEAALGPTSDGRERYPFVHENTQSPEARAIAGEDHPRPHVILLFMESWSAYYEGRARPDGRPYTPVFDAHRAEGLSFAHFYGNSVQTSRGQFATLCSLVPLYRGKEFIDLPGAHLRCLPRVMSDAGYLPVFDSAMDEPDFDDSRNFLGRIGFREMHWADPKARGVDPAVWGSGLADDELYRRFFTRLDDLSASHPGAPLFAVVASTTHHYPWDQNPKHVADPGFETKYRRNYVGSLGVADASLATFFEELDRRPAFRDALVVLVGDHSFPADEHGVHFNGLSAYEEVFRTSALVRWRGHLEGRIDPRTASQLDLAPTLVDLLGLGGRSHFLGHSLVAKDTREPVPLVQPYDGVRLAAVRYPFKLVSHVAAEREHLYDLSSDPDEERDRLADPAVAAELPPLRATIQRIHANRALLKADRIWPPESGGPPPHPGQSP